MMQIQDKPQNLEAENSSNFSALKPTVGFLPRAFFTEAAFQQYQKAREDFIDFVQSLHDANLPAS